jgi:hypothetical protein
MGINKEAGNKKAGFLDRLFRQARSKKSGKWLN